MGQIYAQNKLQDDKEIVSKKTCYYCTDKLQKNILNGNIKKKGLYIKYHFNYGVYCIQLYVRQLVILSLFLFPSLKRGKTERRINSKTSFQPLFLVSN